MRDFILQCFRSFMPQQSAVDRFERMRACVGALFGIFLTGLLTYLILPHEAAAIWLIAPMGASAVLLFAVPASPLAQPWSLIGGNLVAALVGVSCARLVAEPVLAAALAIALAIACMFVLRCIHPPSGAVALTAVLGGPTIQHMGYGFVLTPVLLNSALLLATALFFNNATGRRYPHAQQGEHRSQSYQTHQLHSVAPTERLGFSHEDLDVVLRRYNQVLDISRDDLEEIFLQTEMEAYHRRFGGATCADIMSRDVVAVEFATELSEAWEQMRLHRLQALPVIDRARRVIGILTKTDFLQQLDLQSYAGLRGKLQALLKRTPLMHSKKAEVAGQIMTRSVHTATVSTPIVKLVSLMADEGVHQIPVVDAAHKLVGMITQSDMVAALYAIKLKQMGRAA